MPACMPHGVRSEELNSDCRYFGEVQKRKDEEDKRSKGPGKPKKEDGKKKKEKAEKPKKEEVPDVAAFVHARIKDLAALVANHAQVNCGAASAPAQPHTSLA